VRTIVNMTAVAGVDALKARTPQLFDNLCQVGAGAA